MSTETHNFCRVHLKEVMGDVHSRVSSDIIEHAWGYKYSGENNVEFHINECDELPNGFDWCGSGCCVWNAKAHGWQKYLDGLDEKEKAKTT